MLARAPLPASFQHPCTRPARICDRQSHAGCPHVGFPPVRAPRRAETASRSRSRSSCRVTRRVSDCRLLPARRVPSAGLRTEPLRQWRADVHRTGASAEGAAGKTRETGCGERLQPSDVSEGNGGDVRDTAGEGSRRTRSAGGTAVPRRERPGPEAGRAPTDGPSRQQSARRQDASGASRKSPPAGAARGQRRHQAPPFRSEAEVARAAHFRAGCGRRWRGR